MFRWGVSLFCLLMLLVLPLLLWRNGRAQLAPHFAEKEESVQGVVLDERGSVRGARVRFRGCPRSTTSDEGGRFRLPPIRGERLTAWKEGYFIGGSRSVAPLSISLTPLPFEDNPDYQWVNPSPSASSVGNCANCHQEIYREWAASGHAQSVSGRRFRNLYEGTNWDGDPGVSWGLLNEHPFGAGVCASCHAPTIADEDDAQFDLRRLGPSIAAKGVHCDFCHKIAAVSDGILGVTHGRFNLNLLRPRQGQLFFGPLDDVDRGEDAYSPLYHDSLYCASCHEGILFGVRAYTTYSEWLASPARRRGEQCQDCHMKPTGGMTNVAPGHGGIERNPRTLSNHRFFDGGQAAMLRRCLRVEAECRPHEGEMQAVVRISVEGVGHRVPTGFLDRHLVLLVQGLDADGGIIAPRIGPRLPKPAGDLAGEPGRLYAKLYSDFDGHTPAPFWRRGPEPTDNRLSPEQADELIFVFPRKAARLRVRVLYRRFWQEVVREKGWPDRDLMVLDRTFPLAAESSKASKDGLHPDRPCSPRCQQPALMTAHAAAVEHHLAR